ncbi:hypothetical protein [Deinococcus arboris]|nr:hypothetical protein [Deinococcus arboris]
MTPDTLSLMNLLAVDCLPRIIERGHLQITVIPEVTQEVLRYSESRMIAELQAGLVKLLDEGQIRQVPIEPCHHVDVYCRLYPTLSTVSVCCAILAQQQQSRLISDSQKILSILAKEMPKLMTTTSVGVLKEWHDNQVLTQEELVATVHHSASFFSPSARHPLRHWWLNQL